MTRNQQLKFSWVSELPEQAEKFLSGSARQTVHQGSSWPIINAPDKGQTFQFFMVYDEQAVVAAGLVRLRDVMGGYKIASIQRGPVIDDLTLLQPVIGVLSDALRARNVITLTVNPYILSDEIEMATQALLAAGCSPVSRDLQNFPTVTALIDTTQTEDALMAAMTQTGRRHLRKAIKAGVTCRPMASRQEAEIANTIMQSMAQETGLVLDSQHDFIPHFEHISANPGAGNAIVTEVDGQIFGAAVNYMEGRRGYNMLLCTLSTVAVPRAYVLMWSSILTCKSQGAAVFDMVGFPDDTVESDAGMKARGAFKRGFGPDIVRVLPIMSKPLRPLLHHGVAKLRAVRRKMKKKKAGALT